MKKNIVAVAVLVAAVSGGIAFGSFWDKIKHTATDVYDKTKHVAETAVDKTKEGLEAAGHGIADVGQTAYEKTGEYAQKGAKGFVDVSKKVGHGFETGGKVIGEEFKNLYEDGMQRNQRGFVAPQLPGAYTTFPR